MPKSTRGESPRPRRPRAAPARCGARRISASARASGLQHGTVLDREGRGDRHAIGARARGWPADGRTRWSLAGSAGAGQRPDGRAADRPGRPDSRSSAGSRNSIAQTRAETGLPGRPSTGVAPSRPEISGLPGRMAIFQKSSSKPCGAERALHQVVVADAGAAGGHQQVAGAGGGGGRGDGLACRPGRSAAPAGRRRRRAPGRPAHGRWS